MKKICLILIALIIHNLLFAQSGKLNRISPLTKKYLYAFDHRSSGENAPSGFLYKKGNQGEIYISALIKINNAAGADQQLKNINAIIGTKAGKVWTVRVPYQNIHQFIDINEIEYIQMDEPVKPDLDIARKTTRVDSVQKGINLPMMYSGKDVIMGVVDFGFDYNHPTFYDTTHSAYRIKKVWEMNTNGTPPTGYAYGNEMTDSITIRTQETDNPKEFHGTSVAGIAAGSGFGSSGTNNRFRGMAYESDLILVGVRRDSIEQQWLEGSFTDFVDAINYIFTNATAMGKPCVINISWGSMSGPHDGSTLLNQAIDALTGPGKIVVMSAGNSGQQRLHIQKNFTPSDTTINTFLNFSSPVYKRTWIDVWGDTAKTFCGKVTLYNGTTAGNASAVHCIDDSIYNEIIIGSSGIDTCFVQYINATAEYNGRPRMIIDIYNKTNDSVGISLTANNGMIHGWNEFYYYGWNYGYSCVFGNDGQAWADSGSTAYGVSDMGAGDSILLVGAYASKVNFTDMNGNNWTYNTYVNANRLVPFSSRGPMADGRIKPDITGPGLTLATSMSSFDTSYTEIGSNSALTISKYSDPLLSKDFYYAEFIGTSASSPAAAGIVALMLQAKPSLGPKEVMDIINTTAIKDVFTGAIPAAGNNNWGHGKINAYGAIKAVLATTGLYHYSGNFLNCVLYPNPNRGEFVMTYTAEQNKNLHIEICDLAGRIL